MALESVSFAFFHGLGYGVCSGMVTNEVFSMHCLPQDVADNQIDSGDLMECLQTQAGYKDSNSCKRFRTFSIWNITGLHEEAV